MRSTMFGQARSFRRRGGGSRTVRIAVAVLAGAVVALGVGASEARPARSGQTTISMVALAQYESGWSVLIANFERAYPNITVNPTYAPTQTGLYQLETTELAAGNAPDVMDVLPGCGTPISICELARAGDLAPMIGEPWAKWSLPLITSLDKYGEGLFAFEPIVTPLGVFTNDGLFAKLGLKIPRTFSQLLAVCQKAHADGTAAVILPGASMVTIADLLEDLATPIVYGDGTHWTAALKAGTVSFDGTPGWHQALQEFVDMNDAGCFQPGATGTSEASAETSFAQGQGLMTNGVSSFKGTIDAANPDFSYTFHPFPLTTDRGQPETFLHPGQAVGINAHSSAQNQAAARTFVDFVARPAQNALYAQVTGGLTQYEFLKGQIPAFMSDFATVFKDHEYVLQPDQTWWNPNVLLALDNDEIGLITGQESIDGLLQAMDAAWKQGSD